MLTMAMSQVKLKLFHDLLSFILSYRNNKDLVCTKCKEDQSVESDTSVLTLDQVIKHIFIYLFIYKYLSVYTVSVNI